MSKQITVPDIGYYPIRIEINNSAYTLMPGATVTVPDSVAAIVEAIAANRPQPDPDIADKQPATLGQVKSLISASGGGLPVVTEDDDGKVLGVDDGEWAAVTAPTGLPAVTGDDDGKVLGVSSGAWAAVTAGTSPVEITGTIDSVDDVQQLRLPIAPETLYAAIRAGRSVCVTYSPSDSITLHMVCAVDATEVAVGDNVAFLFIVRFTVPDGADADELVWKGGASQGSDHITFVQAS